MVIENAPWLFAPALVYVFGIVALTLLEIINKNLVPQKWKHRAFLLGMTPLIIVLLIAILSMSADMLYLFPEYTNLQQGFKQLIHTVYGYNNNLLLMIPMGVIYFMVLSVSQSKNVQIRHISSSAKSKTGPNSSGDHRHRQAKLKREWEEDEQISSRLASDEAEGIFT